MKYTDQELIEAAARNKSATVENRIFHSKPSPIGAIQYGAQTFVRDNKGTWITVASLLGDLKC